MRPLVRVRRLARFTGIALLAAASVTAAGCGRPSDETWLRVLRFEKDGTTVVSTVTSVVQKITATTRKQQATDSVDVVFANQSTVVGTSGIIPDGITVDRVRITYSIAGYSPPEAAYVVTLYIPASTSTSTGATTVTGTGTGATNAKLKIALVSTALKGWLVATIPESVLTRGLDATARLVFHARTDAGGELETEAGIGIVFENTVE